MTSNRDASFPAITGIPAFSNFPRLFMALRVSKGWTQYFFLKKISSALYFISLETIYFIKNDFRRSLFHLAGEKIYFIENRFPALSFIWPEKIIMCRQLAVNSTEFFLFFFIKNVKTCKKIKSDSRRKSD